MTKNYAKRLNMKDCLAIFTELKKCLVQTDADKNVWRYMNDKSDAKIAQSLGYSRTQIVRVRTDMFGQLDTPRMAYPEMVTRVLELEKRLASAELELETLRGFPKMHHNGRGNGVEITRL